MATAAAGHPAHEACRRFATRHAPAIAGHASIEAFSVLTRLPVAARLPGAAAARLLNAHFPRAIWPSVASMERFVEDCSARGITGGAVYDALVALAAAEHGARLVSLDRRAAATYRAMGVETVAPAHLARRQAPDDAGFALGAGPTCRYSTHASCLAPARGVPRRAEGPVP